MRPSVDTSRTRPHALSTTRDAISLRSRSARRLLCAKSMRTTSFLFCALLPACVGMGQTQQTPPTNAGSGACSDPVPYSDGSFATAADFATVPTGCYSVQTLEIEGPAITSLAQLGQLAWAGDVVIENTALTKFDSPIPLVITGSLTIRDNTKLADVASLDPTGELTKIDVENNPALGMVMLPDVTRVTGPTTVRGNDQLVHFELPAATRLEGGLELDDNPMLMKLDLSSVYSVTDHFTVRGNPMLATLGSLGALQFVHGLMTIDGNNMLDLGDSMTGSIESVDMGVLIQNNGKLSALGNLSHATSLGPIEILSNHSLSFCAAQDVPCCVPHSGTPIISDNQDSSCGASAWCGSSGQTCPYGI